MLSRNQIKTLAFIFMFIDHIGAILFPTQYLFRIVGRLSFPLFAYLIAQGISLTKNPKNMLKRLLLFAFISQIPFVMAFHLPSLFFSWNIFMTLALGTCFCVIYKENSLLGAVSLPCLAVSSQYVFRADYGVYGVFVIGFFFLELEKLKQNNKESSVVQTKEIRKRLFNGLFLLSLFYSIFHLTFFPLFASLAAFVLPASDKKEKSWGMYGYFIYPLHLILLKFIIVFCNN